MEYGEVIDNNYVPIDVDQLARRSYIRSFCDQNNMRFVGWSKNFRSTACLDELFSYENIKMIQNKVAELTLGISEEDRPFLVPESTICSLLSELLINQRPKVGDIYSRYTVPDSSIRDDVLELTQKCIQIIYDNIKTSIGMEKNNAKLTIWDSIYSEGNPRGLNSVPHGFAKIAHKRPQSMFFFSNY